MDPERGVTFEEALREGVSRRNEAVGRLFKANQALSRVGERPTKEEYDNAKELTEGISDELDVIRGFQETDASLSEHLGMQIDQKILQLFPGKIERDNYLKTYTSISKNELEDVDTEVVNALLGDEDSREFGINASGNLLEILGSDRISRGWVSLHRGHGGEYQSVSVVLRSQKGDMPSFGVGKGNLYNLGQEAKIGEAMIAIGERIMTSALERGDGIEIISNQTAA